MEGLWLLHSAPSTNRYSAPTASSDGVGGGRESRGSLSQACSPLTLYSDN